MDERERFCECEHPESRHDGAGCTVLISDPDGTLYGRSWTCSCTEFTEAQTDTLESLGVDVL